jgi:hypothetical protein
MHANLAHAPAVSAPAVHAGSRDRTFFTAAAIANALIIVGGFGYSTYARLQLGDPRFGGPTLTTLVRVHASVATVWTVLLIVQTRLIAARRIRLHRRLGVVGGVTAATVVGLGWVVAVTAVGRFANDGEPSATMALRFFILPCQELAVFTILVGAALWLRKRGDYHKRLVLLGTIALIPAATTRPFFPGGVPNTLMMFGLAEAIFVVALCTYDRRMSGHIHAATVWGGGVLLVTAVLRMPVAQTDAWLAVARLLVR